MVMGIIRLRIRVRRKRRENFLSEVFFDFKIRQRQKRTRINKDYPAYRIGNSKLEYKKVKTTITLFNQLKKFLKKGYDMKFLNNQLILYNHFLDSNNILNIEVSK